MAAESELTPELTDAVARGGTLVVIGAPGRGKSTLALALARAAAAHGPSFLLDGDPGQRAFGLPTTIGLLELRPPEGNPAAAACWFVGSTSPVGHLLPLLVGMRRLVDRAREAGFHLLVVDTTGLVDGPLGLELKLHKLDLLAPATVVAIGHEGELEPLATVLARRYPLHRLRPHPRAVLLGPAARRERRRERYAAYFRNATELVLRSAPGATWGPMPRRLHERPGRLVGLVDRSGFCLAVGRLLDVDPGGRRIVVAAPPLSVPVHTVRYGSVSVDTEGNDTLLAAGE